MVRRIRPIAVTALSAVIILIAGCEGTGDGGGPMVQSVDTLTTVQPSEPVGADLEYDGEPAPYFALDTIDGEILTLEDLQGNVIVLNFWATWCAPCRVEIPDLIEMQAELEDDGVRIVGVSLDHEGIEVIRSFAEDMGINYPIVIDDGEVADAYGGIYALPTTILIDREGNVRRKISGLVTTDFLMPLLEDLAG